MQNNYEIIGNQIKVFFKGDTTHHWNNIPSPQFRNLNEIKEWCGSANDEAICYWDALNQNAMSSTEVTDFLYRFSTSYFKVPIDGIQHELANIRENAPGAWEVLKNDGIELAVQGYQQIFHAAMDLIANCVSLAIEWGPELLTILFPF